MDDLCIGCGNCPNSGPWVGPRNSPTSPIAIIGEAPGVQELNSGQPFIGPSGKLLDSMLKKAGFSDGLEGCYITNALQCRPKESPPNPFNLAACQPRLFQELEGRQFKLILALGNSAIRSLMNDGSLKISTERGRVFDTDWGPLFATYHPAALLRNPQLYGQAQRDINNAIALLSGTRRDPGNTKRTILTRETLGPVVERLITLPKLSGDLETSGLDFMKDRILMAGVCWAKNRVFIIPEALLDEPEVKLLFEAPGPLWDWHHGKFDIKFLWRRGIQARLDNDSLYKHYALDEVKGTHDLKTLSQVYLGADKYAQELKPYLKSKSTSFEVIPKDVLAWYLAKDCDYQWQLSEALDEELDQPNNKGLRELYEETLLPAARFLARVEYKGIWVNPDRLLEVARTMEQQLAEARERVVALAEPYWDALQYANETGTASIPKYFNPGSPSQVAWILYNRLKLRPLAGYAKNTREDTLNNLTTSHPFVDALLEWRGIAKEYSTYIQGIAGGISEDGRVHTTFNVHGTVTGRLSSSAPKGANG